MLCMRLLDCLNLNHSRIIINIAHILFSDLTYGWSNRDYTSLANTACVS